MTKNAKTKTKVNNKNNALLEIGLEEVPARFMPAMLADLKEKAEKDLQTSRLPFNLVQTFGTPRRLVLYIEGIPAKQEAISKEVKGPSREVAFAGNGKPTKAAEGFAASQGVAVTDLKIQMVGKKEFVFASVTEKGVEAEQILEALFPKLIRSLYLPISMRWGSVDFRFIRTIHWIFASCGNKQIDFEIAGIRSSLKTRGHRYFSAGPITINITKGTDIKAFKRSLFAGKVILDQDERREKIIDMVRSAAKKLGGTALLDSGLIEEVNHLVEWPQCVTGRFKTEFLSLPKDVLITSMKKNQKYFSVIDPSEKLMPVFINITNGINPEDLKSVAEGNERVLAARLNDAKFFFDEDRQDLLADLVPKLTKVAFYEKLGSMYEKVERITALSAWIAHELKLPDSKKDNIKEIAGLCKADLLTQMVYEFGSLQGVMGREYSLLEGKPKEIANGIFEHYLPRFTGDKLPASIEGAVVGIADKIDSIVGCFSINLIPTGSEDPYGLRRQAYGIVNIILDKKIYLELDDLIEKAYKLYEPLFLGEIFASGKVKFNEIQKVIPDVLSFIAARVKVNMLDAGIKYDVADAVLSAFEDVFDAFDKAKAISKYLDEAWLTGIVMTMDRVKRLGMNATRSNVVTSDFICDEEKSLYDLCLNVNAEAGEQISKGDYDAALKALSKLTKPVDDFFVKVMVMDKDEKLRVNRLALLKTLEDLYMEYADFTKIVK